MRPPSCRNIDINGLRSDVRSSQDDNPTCYFTVNQFTMLLRLYPFGFVLISFTCPTEPKSFGKPTLEASRAITLLSPYDWPGNVREWAMFFYGNDIISAEDLSLYVAVVNVARAEEVVTPNPVIDKRKPQFLVFLRFSSYASS